MRKKFISITVILVMLLSYVTSLPLTVSASTNGHSQSEAVSWVNSQVGQAYTGNYGAQCVDFVRAYYEYLGQAKPFGNANQYGNGGAFTPSGWTYQSSPQPGDIAVWTGGDNGHVAVVTEIRGSQMVCVEQNYAGKMYCSPNLHNINAQTYIRPDFSAPSPAKAYKSVSNGDYIIVSALNNSKAIDITSGATWSGANVQLYDKDGTPAQDFRITKSGDYYTIQNINSGCNLDVANGSRNSGTNIWQYTPDGTDAQKWRFVDAGGGYVYIESVLGTYIDVSGAGTANGTNIQAYSFNGTDAQKWKLVSISSNSAEPSVAFLPWDNGNFTYVRETDASIGQEINVSGGTCTDTGMYLYDANGNLLAKAANSSYYYRIYFKINEELGYKLTSGTTYKYKFYAVVNGKTYWSNEYSFKTDGPTPTAVSTDVSGACGIEEGTYTLTPACATGSRLDIANASTDSGANVQLHSANNTIAQEFTIESVGKPYYKIVAKCSGMVLDVQGALTDSGTNVFQHPYHGGTNQRWIFVDAGGGYYYIRPANNTNLSLDVWNGDSADGTNIWVYNSNRSNAQKWKLNKVVTDTQNPVITVEEKTETTDTQPTQATTGEDYIRIVSVSPESVKYGDSVTFTANVEYSLQSRDEGIIYLGVNTEERRSYKLYDEYRVSKGKGKAKLSATVTVSNMWDTVVYVNISAYPHEYSWNPIETDKINIDSYKDTDIKENGNKTEAYSFRFPRMNVYHQDQFDDVKANQWFSQSVADAFEMGLVKGVSNTEFNPYGDVTVAEAVTMAARIHSIYTTGNENFTPGGGMWYQVYLDYAYDSGIISRAYYNSDVSQKATRAQFAEIFANAMDDKGLYEINTVKDNAIPDVKMTAQYADDVYKLYRAGILAGNDVLGTFSPNTYITRAEVSAILARMSDTSNRLTFTMK